MVDVHAEEVNGQTESQHTVDPEPYSIIYSESKTAISGRDPNLNGATEVPTPLET